MATQALVLVAVISRAGPDALPFGRRYTVAELAHPLGLKERTVRGALAALKASGHLALERNGSGHVTPRVIWPFPSAGPPPREDAPRTSPTSSHVASKPRGEGSVAEAVADLEADAPPPTTPSPQATAADNTPHLSDAADSTPHLIRRATGQISTGTPGGYPQAHPADNRLDTPLRSSTPSIPASSVHRAREGDRGEVDPREAEIADTLRARFGELEGVDVGVVAAAIFAESAAIFPTPEAWEHRGRAKLAEAAGFSASRLSAAAASASPLLAAAAAEEIINRARRAFRDKTHERVLNSPENMQGVTRADAIKALELYGPRWLRARGHAFGAREFTFSEADVAKASVVVAYARRDAARFPALTDVDILEHWHGRHLADDSKLVADSRWSYALIPSRISSYGLPGPRKAAAPPVAAPKVSAAEVAAAAALARDNGRAIAEMMDAPRAAPGVRSR